MGRKKIIIIGAGPGGLAAAMLLSAKGYKVQMFEKQPFVGGRTSSFQLGEFTFDLGPTILCMPHLLEEIFQLSHRNLKDYLEMKEVDPLYSLMFHDLHFRPVKNIEALVEYVEKQFPGEGKNCQRFFYDTKKKFEALLPILENKYDSLADLSRWRSIRALPVINLRKSMYDVAASYFQDERLRLTFSFQAKYIGMSPWECPGVFSILPYIEHEFGIHHPIGGLNQLTKAMAKVVKEDGVEIHTNCGINKLIIEHKQVQGVELDNGERVLGDEVIMNADFAYGMKELVDDSQRKKYNNKALKEKGYSCSTFMIYAGVNRPLPLDHHNFIFSKSLKKNMDEVVNTGQLPEDPSIYFQHAKATDETMAPNGKAGLYILVPVPNGLSEIDWVREQSSFRHLIWSIIEKKTGINIQDHIEMEKIVTPADWEKEHFVYKGANFSLKHTLNQLLYFRPHNDFEEFKHLWLVGGGTHPGSGLPSIIESAKITTGLIIKSHN